MKKIVLSGPPRSGKSCLIEGLKQAIRAIPDAPYPYRITACPDGEGSWYQEAVNHHPESAAQQKAKYKSSFTPEFVERVAASVWNCREALTLVDIGGIVDDYNERICAGATHIVILASEESLFDEWRKFANKVNLTIVAEILSDYHGAQDQIEGVGTDGVLRGSVHYLERGQNVSLRPVVRALAEHILSL